MPEKDSISLEKRVEILETQLAELRNMIVASKPKLEQRIDERESVIIANIEDIGVQDAVKFSLRIKGPQTKQQIKDTLNSWGVPFRSWFDGGNFNNRLLKAGIVKVDGKTDDGEEIYSLTMNGERITDERIAGLEK
jgi:hypothetical protein